MGNNGVRNIVLLVILVVMSFFLGIQASDGAKTPIMYIGVLVGIFGLLYLGERVWMAIYLLPPIIPLVTGTVSFAGVWWALLCAPCVFAYWIVMRVMGYVRMRWQGQIIIDSIVAIFFLYTAITFYRRPVAIAALNFDSDAIGGRAYVVALLSCVSYIGCSLIPMGYEKITKISRLLFYVTLICIITTIFKTVIFGGSASQEEGDLLDQAQNSRFGLFAPLGLFVIYSLYGTVPLMKIIATPRYLLTMILAFFAILLSGWRSKLLMFVASIGGLALVKREVVTLTIGGLCVYGILFYLGEEGLLEELPQGVQRSLCALPGHLKVKDSIRRDTRASSEWRKVMWRWAMDPRTRLIRNYIWGDGLGDSAADIGRSYTAGLRGMIQGADQREFARRGAWHSGWVTMIHRVGIIGLGLGACFHVIVIYFVLFVFRIYRNTEAYRYIIPLVIQQLGTCIAFYISAGVLENMYISIFQLCYVKLLYCAAREKGMVPDLFRQQSYIPLAIQDIKQQTSSQ